MGDSEPGAGQGQPGSRALAGRLEFRPRPSAGRAEGFDGPLGLSTVRDGILYVPDTVERSAPVLVYLHGAGGSARRELRLVLAAADRYGVVIAAPDSRDQTWDVLTGGFGPDVQFVDRVLDAVTDRCDVDPTRLAIGGISDGASYALTMGLANGDVFEAIVALSPGFAAPGGLVGKPRVFVSHGVHDRILPIDACSRRLVPALEREGYDVTYVEFDGGHDAPPPIADRAFRWLCRTDAEAGSG
ncbi:MAG: phospholipase/carboxylesterase [Acidimicrobiaceae bacterium]|nr:phospholipase/carboxylesterase [Acidimicrobiaceae bacterium]